MDKKQEFERLSVEELIANDGFMYWVKCPDEASEAYWEQMVQDPDNRPIIAEARRLILALEIKEDFPSGRVKSQVWKAINDSLDTEQQSSPPRKLRKNFFIQIAASVMLAISIGVWLYLAKPDNHGNEPNSAILSASSGNPIGKIHLSDGRVLSFQNVQKGVLAESVGFSIRKDDRNKLIYQYDSDARFHIDSLTSPIGEVWEIVLPDGSTAWLNTQSTLRFVHHSFRDSGWMDAEGEIYFSVAKDMSRPLKVVSGNVEVTVLGTDFVVSKYADETTLDVALVDGSVRIKHAQGESMIMKPGDRASYKGLQTKPAMSRFNTQNFASWKQGIFAFSGDSISDVMSTLARWYGVSIRYDGPKPQLAITGTIPHGVSLVEALAILEETGVDAQFTVSNQHVVVQHKK